MPQAVSTASDYILSAVRDALYGRLNIPQPTYRPLLQRTQVYHPCPAPQSGSFAAANLSPPKTPSRLHLKHDLPLTAGVPAVFALEVQGHRGPQQWSRPQLRTKAKAPAKRADQQG